MPEARGVVIIQLRDCFDLFRSFDFEKILKKKVVIVILIWVKQAYCALNVPRSAAVFQKGIDFAWF